MVNSHLPEINHTVLVLLHLILDCCNLGGKVLLTFEKTLEHTTADVVSLLLDDLKIFLDGVKLRLQYLLLYLRRLGYLAELVM